MWRRPQDTPHSLHSVSRPLPLTLESERGVDMLRRRYGRGGDKLTVIVIIIIVIIIIVVVIIIIIISITSCWKEVRKGVMVQTTITDNSSE